MVRYRWPRRGLGERALRVMRDGLNERHKSLLARRRVHRHRDDLHLTTTTTSTTT